VAGDLILVHTGARNVGYTFVSNAGGVCFRVIRNINALTSNACIMESSSAKYVRNLFLNIEREPCRGFLPESPAWGATSQLRQSCGWRLFQHLSNITVESLGVMLFFQSVGLAVLILAGVCMALWYRGWPFSDKPPVTAIFHAIDAMVAWFNKLQWLSTPSTTTFKSVEYQVGEHKACIACKQPVEVLRD
jgi:hypothetical protein